MTTPKCIPLEAVSGEAVGGKAEGLVRLLGYGLSVPPGFVVTGATTGNLPDDLDEQYRRIGAGKVAVRSSAIGEDSGEASFAGQYETVLNVEGPEALRSAIDDCLRSAENARAVAYRAQQTGQTEAQMNVVVQQMVDARTAGVLFTVNPVNARRDQVVVDAVEGLGEKLVSGHATPDHWLLGRDGSTFASDVRGDEPVLSQQDLMLLLDGALQAEARYATPLDMEWAIDQSGALRWLQARPITGLPADPNELDTDPDPRDVYTWCNIGEMMPGAVTPLTYSTTGRGIDIGMQRAYRRMGAKIPPGEGIRYVGMFFGHLFINLTTLAELAADVAGSTKSQMCIALCGRDVEEVADPEPASTFKRAINGARYFAILMAAAKHRRELDSLRRDNCTAPSTRAFRSFGRPTSFIYCRQLPPAPSAPSCSASSQRDRSRRRRTTRRSQRCLRAHSTSRAPTSPRESSASSTGCRRTRTRCTRSLPAMRKPRWLGSARRMQAKRARSLHATSIATDTAPCASSSCVRRSGWSIRRRSLHHCSRGFARACNTDHLIV
jgi:hypothetical protein